MIFFDSLKVCDIRKEREGYEDRSKSILILIKLKALVEKTTHKLLPIGNGSINFKNNGRIVTNVRD